MVSWVLASLFFYNVGSFKRRAQKVNKSDWVRFQGRGLEILEALHNPGGPLYWQILARLYILMFDNA